MNERENYIISFVTPKKIPLTLLKGKVTDRDGSIPGKTEITVTDNATGEVEGVYYSDKLGHYSLILPAGKNNNITFQTPGCLFQSDNITVNTEADYYKKHHVVVMSPLDKGSKVLLNNVFFDSAKTVLNKLSDIELNRIHQLLQNNPEMKIRLDNYVHCNKNICYSKKFAKERAKTVATWLTQNGIDKERIKIKGYRQKKQNKSGVRILSNEASLNQLELVITDVK
jgi:outer membrane protein OmpA-like peptidoglycan-associated protein